MKGLIPERSLLVLPSFLVIMILFGGCKKSDEEPTPGPYGKITFTFSHQVDGKPLRKNELIYTNAAGNEYLVTDLMYFISDITLYGSDGKTRMIKDGKDIFYIDEAITPTTIQPFADKIAPGSYDSVSFIFGITEEKNKSNLFVNPPEMIMAWPAVLGGGYHYMMLNGKWKDTLGSLSPFNLHLGIGQLYRGNSYNTDSIYAFVQNCFRVSLPGSAFTLRDKDSLVFNITMHIDRWFDTPHVYDFNFWGGHIMQKQPAMQAISENGCNVFQISKLPE